jgi:hypothetical protein
MQKTHAAPNSRSLVSSTSDTAARVAALLLRVEAVARAAAPRSVRAECRSWRVASRAADERIETVGLIDREK